MAEEPNSKLKGIISSHEQMKIAFHQLKAQIKFGLLEAEDVFASLSMPLMRLVGLKTVEMAHEGRFNTVVFDADDSFRGCRKNGLGFETLARSASPAENGDDQIHRSRKFEDESYTTKATMAGKELRRKQQLQLTQLVHLLRKIETQVNTSQNDIIETLTNHRVSLHEFFHRAISYISHLQHPSQNQDAFLITLKLLKITFEHVAAALGSVESGVEGLMQELAEQMCDPMVEYVKCLKAEMTTGTCQHLLAMVDEMGVIMRDGRLELEEARKKVKVAEERKLEALSRLTESEERGKRMKEYLGVLLEDKKNFAKPFVPHQLLDLEKDQGKHEKLLWELLKKKRKCRIPDSPIGGEGLLYAAPNNKMRKPTMARPSIIHRPVTRSFSRELAPQTPRFETWLPLGLSPSASNQQIMLRKRIIP